MEQENNIKTICIVGLGYTGLPLAIAFSKFFEVVGFDVNKKRIEELKSGRDATGEMSPEALQGANILFTSDPQDIKKADLISVCLPTPIDKHKKPDFSCLKDGSRVVGQNLKEGAIVVFESTVYPGATEEVCLPVLEESSGKKAGDGFKIGYSPERVNPGDKTHTIDTIVKVVAGQDKETTEALAQTYGKIITAGIHKAPNIKTAEAAKVIENIQRDLNIALMNELSKVFSRIGIETKDVLAAASTKWNFHKYYPGLVGGHCIGIDPYYLTYKAEELGYHPEVILAGRRINDSMHKFVAEKLIKALNKAGKAVSKAKVLVMGLTFKENVKDPRNTRVKQLIEELQNFGAEVLACEPMLEDDFIEKEFGVQNQRFSEVDQVDAIILAVSHKAFDGIGLKELKEKLKEPPILIDLKWRFSKEEAESQGIIWEGL